MEYKYGCVVDDNNRYIDYIITINKEPQFYTLKDGEQIIETPPPELRPYAGMPGFIIPIFKNGAWIEGATAAEIDQWEQGHPPEPEELSPIEALQAENNLLKAQIAAATNRQEFLEDCIAEMAMQVYNV